MRRITIVLATMLLAVTAYAATFGLWAAAEVADEDSFVESAIASFDRPGSDDALGEVVAIKVVERFPALSLFGGTLSSLFSALVTTDAFLPARADVSRQVYATMFEDASRPVVIDLADYREEVLESVAAIAPNLVELIPDAAFGTFVIFEAHELPDVSRAAGSMATLGWGALIVSLLIVSLLVLVPRDPAVSLLAIGIALMVVAAALWAIVTIASGYVGDAAPSQAYSVLAKNLYHVLVEPLVTRVRVIGVAGIVMTALGVTLGLRSGRTGTTQT